MTYFQFHLLFLVPPLLLLAWLGRKDPFYTTPKAVGSLLVIACIAFVYTTPWDNMLVETGVWGYGEGRVLGTWGYVPIEEYMFFVLQPLLTGLFLYRLLASSSSVDGKHITVHSGAAHWAGTLFYTYASLFGLLLLGQESTYYLALILVWACPILAFQWAYGGNYLWARRNIFLTAALLPTVYLWIADRIAIGNGIWYISERYTTGWHLFGLPIEEAVFFLVTNLLIVQGLLLSVHKWDAFIAFFDRKKLAWISR